MRKRMLVKTYRCLAITLSCWLVACSPAGVMNQDSAVTESEHNNLLYAVAWKQTAAEYQALYLQGFNLARLRVQQALANPVQSELPLAVISDLDDTLLLAHDYWGYLLSTGRDFFDDSSWDAWVAQQRTVPSPGALDFLRFCADNNIEVFYITNRDQGEATFELALQNLQASGFPYADVEHLTVLRETSNKETVQDAIRENFNVVVMLGDNLNDFSRKYYVADIEERRNLLSSDQERFGQDFIVFPNPTDGHWIRAIFGESEPAPTAENRAQLHAAATRQAWVP